MDFSAKEVSLQYELLKDKEHIMLPALDNVLFFEEIDSTQAEIFRRISSVPSFEGAEKSFNYMLAIASFQTAGKGRQGRVFVSPRNLGIYFSFLYIPPKKNCNPASVTTSVSVALCRAIDSVFGTSSQIKWVNDIYVNGRKVSGILTEGVTSRITGELEAFVVGIGINILMPEDVFRKNSNLLGRAGGIMEPLSDIKDAKEMCSPLLSNCMFNIIKILETEEPVMAEYKSRSFLKDKIVEVFPLAGVDKTSYKAKVLDITEDAGLKVLLEDGSEKVLHSGEVSLHNGIS